MKPFSRADAIRFGWETVKNNLGFFIPFSFAFILLYIIPYWIAYWVLQTNVLLGAILHIADYALTILMTLGFVKVSLKFYDGERVSFGDLFSQYRLLFSALVATILYLVAILGGFLLLIIPGIILIIKFYFVYHFIVDSHVGPIGALERSWAITRGIKWHLFIFSLMLVGVYILGVLFFLVGVIVAFPVTILATAFAYRKLLERSQMTSAPSATPLADEAMPLQR